MKDKTRLAITGAAALAALAVTVGGHGLHFNIGDDGGSGSGDDAQGMLAPGNLKDFDGVVLTGPDDVVITQDKGFSVKAEGDQSAIDQLKFFVSDRTLHIERKSGWTMGSSGSATIKVTLPALQRVSLTGPGDMDVDKLAGKQVKAEVTGPGNLSIKSLAAESAQIDLTGTGDLTVSGRAGTAALSSTGSGNIVADALETEHATLKLIGAGDINVRASRDADISIMGAGDAHVAGTTVCKVSKIGVGEANCTG